MTFEELLQEAGIDVGSDTIPDFSGINSEHYIFSKYAVILDPMVDYRALVRDQVYNLMFLFDRQKHANDKLKEKGHLFLNEVYDMLNQPRTKEGQIVGWIYDKNIRDKVDFGICNYHNRYAVNGCKKSIWTLDFNIDGIIIDKI